MTRRKRIGFTLVELLVVIGIIAMLIAILLPVLNKAKEAGNNAKCLSQLNQFHKASKLWLADNPSKQVFSGSGGFTAPLMKYVRDARIFICPSDDNPTGGNLVTQVALLINNTGEILAFAPGPRVSSPAPGASGTYPANPYTLGFEDTPPPASDMDFNDVCVSVTTNPDGTVKITVISNSASYTFSLVDATTHKVIVADFKTVGASDTVPGTLCSYGWTSQDNSYARNGKVLALDYYQLNANPLIDGASTWLVSPKIPSFARHSQLVNVLWSDGGAASAQVDLIRLPGTQAMKNKYWMPIKD